MKVEMIVNGEKKVFEVDPSETLLDVLRKNGYLSVKKGCDTGTCGACTVLMDGVPVLSCVIFAGKAHGHEITTVEGIESDMKEFAEKLAQEGADQCGYCAPGLVVMVYYLKKMYTNLSEEDINKFLIGNLCRCSGYQGQTRAIKKFLGVRE